jgi:hypothetical protein
VYASTLGTSASFAADSVRVWLRNGPDEVSGFIGALLHKRSRRRYVC